MQNAQKTILCLNDFTGVGRSGLYPAIGAWTAMGFRVVPVATTLLSTHTGGFGMPAALSTGSYMRSAMQHYRTLGLTPDAIYCGYLAAEGAADAAQYALELWPDAFKIVDPVMGDNGRLYTGITPEVCGQVQALCQKADLITPNLTEAKQLLGLALAQECTLQQAEQLGVHLAEQGRSVVITGVGHQANVANVVAAAGKSPLVIEQPKKQRSFPGTGDLFGAVLVGYRLRGFPLEEATQQAADFVSACIDATPQESDTRFGVHFESCLVRLLNA